MKLAVVPAAVTRELRRAVLRPAWPPGSVMHGDDVPDAVHLAAADDDGAVVAAATLLPAAYPQRPDVTPAWQLRGMATAEGRRGQGVGAAVLAEAVRQVRRHGAAVLWCQARIDAVPFYARHGFVAEGEPFVTEETGISHRWMYLTLEPAPAPEPSSAPDPSNQ